MATELELIEAELARRQQPAAAPAPNMDLSAIDAELERRGVAIPKEPAKEIRMLPKGPLAAAIVEPALTIGSAMLAEPYAAGTAMYEFAVGNPDVRSAVDAAREKLTFKPRTEMGQKSLQAVGKVIEPIGKGLEFLSEKGGDVGLEVGGPVTGAIGATLPYFALEMLGVFGGKGAASTAKTLTKETAEQAASIASGVNKAVKTIIGDPAIKVFDDAGNISDDALRILQQKADDGIDVNKVVLEAVKETTDVTPQMAERFNLFKRRGIEPTRAQVTQTTDDWRLQQDLIKETGDVSKLVAYQDAKLADLAREGKASIGAVADDAASTNQSLFQAVNDIVETADNAASQAYKAADASVQSKPVVSLDNFSKELHKLTSSNSRSGGLIDDIVGDLESRGILKKGEYKPAGKLSPKTAESIRQELNARYGDTLNDFSTSAAVSRQIIKKLKDAIDEDATRDIGIDVFFEARKAKKKMHDLVGLDKSGKFDQYTGSILEDILYNKIPQEQIAKKILSTPRPEEFHNLYRFFTEKSGDQGLAAWNNLKASVMEEAITKAMGAPGEGGIPTFKADAFAKTFQPLKSMKAGKGANAPSRFDVMFSAEEKALINDLIQIGNLRRPLTAVPKGSGPSGFSVYRSANALLEKAMPQAMRDALEARARKKLQRQAVTPPTIEIQKAVKEASR